MDTLLLLIYILAFGSIFWVLLTLKKTVYGAGLLCFSLFCFYQYVELQDVLDDMCSSQNFIMEILMFEDCDQVETYQNRFLFSGIGSAFFGLYLMFKPN